jgi:hypothetical protein
MNLDWILSPLALYAVIALALAVCLAAFVTTKMEVCRLRRSAADSAEALARKIAEMQLAVTEMAKRSVETTESASPAVVRPSVNLTKRTQALRMRRRGESAESIAAALAAPRNEIELLLKVHEMLDLRKN